MRSLAAHASSFLPGIFQMMPCDLSLDDKIDRFVETHHTRLARHKGTL